MLSNKGSELVLVTPALTVPPRKRAHHRNTRPEWTDAEGWRIDAARYVYRGRDVTGNYAF